MSSSDAFGRMGDHAFLERPQYAGTLDFDRCGYCGVNREHHGEPSDAVVRGGRTAAGCGLCKVHSVPPPP